MQFSMLIASLAAAAQLAVAIPAGATAGDIAATKDRRAWILIGGASCVKAACYDRVDSVYGEDEVAEKSEDAETPADAEVAA